MSLAKYPPETASILHRDIFWFFLKYEEFVSKTINDSNSDLDKFPASKVKQLAKKMETSKSTARHIKAVASDPKQHKLILWGIRELTSHQTKPSGNIIPTCLDQRVTRSIQGNTIIKDHPTSQDLIQARHNKHVEGLNILQESFIARPAINMGTLLACAIRRRYLTP